LGRAQADLAAGYRQEILAVKLIFEILCAFCVLGAVVVAMMYRHLKVRHPKTWAAFQFPERYLNPKPSEEAEHARASLRHLAFMWSKERRNLCDSYYNGLVAAFNILFSGVILLLLAAMAALIRSRPN
jgi:hypothetical protein